MGIPSTQTIAFWIKETLTSEQWILLQTACNEALQVKLPDYGESSIAELVEDRLRHVAEALRNEASEFQEDGNIASFEIDNEESPYIRLTGKNFSHLLDRIRAADPFLVEELCAKILNELGATAYATQKTNDGGVDFIGLKLKIVPAAFGLPTACMAAVIGQTKRHKQSNIITETQLREFVGAATLKCHEMRKEGKIGPLSPVVFAFWTTSDFDGSAKKYARSIGLWYMGGHTLAHYVENLGLQGHLDNEGEDDGPE